eukprot:5199304-Karenia_brevis.AAC.1
MFRATEYTGSYMRLDSFPGLTPDTAEAPEDPILEDVVKSAKWRVVCSRYFSETAHVNLQEAQEFADEFRRRSSSGRP